MITDHVVGGEFTREQKTRTTQKGYLPDDSAYPGDVFNGVPKHDEVHGLLTLSVELSQVLLHGGLQDFEVLHLFVHLSRENVHTYAVFCAILMLRK